MDDNLLAREEGAAAGTSKNVLVPAGSPVGIAAAEFTVCVRQYRWLSILQPVLPQGVVGIVWSSVWLCNPLRVSEGEEEYFERMQSLFYFVLRAKAFIVNAKFAVIVGSASALAPLASLPFFLGTEFAKADFDVRAVVLYAIAGVVMFSLSASHVALAVTRLLPAAFAFVDAATPLLEAKLLSREEMARYQDVSLSATRIGDLLGLERFVGGTHTLMTGQNSDAVRGLYHFLCVPEVVLLQGLVEGTSAIIREVEAIGEPALTRALHAFGLCEDGNVRLSELTTHKRAVAAGLREAHIVAIRLYTSADGFAHFNDPLRDQARMEARRAHPLALTMAFLADGVRKLRLEFIPQQAPPVPSGVSSTRFAKSGVVSTVLYRGLRGVTIGDAFMEGLVGGTELAATSTTSDWDVAVSFVLRQGDGPPLPARQSVILRLLVANAVQYGADVEWLSVNPAEHEVIFPPLLYLQPTGRFEVVHYDGAKLTVVEVVPFV